MATSSPASQGGDDSNKRAETSASSFAQLSEAFISAELERDPRAAEALGAEGYGGRLGDFSAESFVAAERADVAWLARFESLDDGELSADERIDRDLVCSQLRARVGLVDSGWQAWRRSPEGYLETGITEMFLAALRPEDQLVAEAASRLGHVEGMVEGAIANLDPDCCDPLVVRHYLAGAEANVGFARDEVVDYATTDANRAVLRAAGARAARAYERLAVHLRDLAERSRGSFSFGKERYDLVLKVRELLDYDTATLAEMGRAEYERVAGRMSELARELTGDADWTSCAHELKQIHAADCDGVRDAYATKVAEARKFALERGLVSAPSDDECRVLAAPSAVRAVLSVACYIPPPMFAPSKVGHFFVPYPVDASDTEEIAGLLESNADYYIAPTAVHEAYPGHHWQLVSMKAARPLRRLFLGDYFAEGWALYTEAVAAREGFFSLAEEFAQQELRLFRAARVVVDVGLHTGTMPVDEAVGFMHAKSLLPMSTARAEVARYCSWPTQASSYLTGALAFEEAAQRWTASGRDLRSFHDGLGRAGAMPIPLAVRAIS